MEGKGGFSRLRGFFFPIYRYELKKIVPLGFILFFSLFNHYCLKNIKDSLIVTAAGAEAISFIKLFCVPPCAIAFMLIYTKLSDCLKSEHLYYVTLGIFISFFVFFALVLYPLREKLHPSLETIVHYQSVYPMFFWGFVIYGSWSYVLFYIFAELWSSFILTLLFWQFMNQITSLQEAKRIYPFLLFLGQSSVVLSGWIGAFFSDIRGKVLPGTDPWQVTLYWLIGIVSISSLLSMYLYHWIYQHVLTDKRLYTKLDLPGIRLKKKGKSSLRESLKLVCHSSYLGLLTVLVMSYGITDNMIENFWKNELRQCYPNANEYNAFMSHYTMAYGIMSLVALLFAGGIFRKFSWCVGAILTPIVMITGGTCLFVAVLSKNFLLAYWEDMADFQIMIVMLGMIVLVLDKAFKMVFFDMSKEMAFIPLSEELKVKGKAIIDVFGHRFGKSFGSGLQVVLLTLITALCNIKATYADIAIYAFFIFLIFSFLWLIAIFRLNKRIQKNKEMN